MHATKTLLLLASCALCGAFALTARADYQAISGTRQVQMSKKVSRATGWATGLRNKSE